MWIRCPHCATDVDLERARTDGGSDDAGPVDRLHGFAQTCANCGDAFSVYLY